MREALHYFGVVSAGTDTTTYTADEVYLGTITSAYRRSLHALGLVDDLWVRFIVTTIFASGTSAQPGLYSTAAASSTTLILAGPVILTATLVLGYEFVLPVPMEVNTYLRAGLLTVGAMTGACQVGLEFGPNIT